MSEELDAALERVQVLIAGKQDLISRIAAPLWARVGRPLAPSELGWVRPLLGENGPEILVQALSSFNAFDQGQATLNAKGLMRLLASLLNEPYSTSKGQPVSPKLVWTLPQAHPSHTLRGQSYRETCLQLIHESTSELVLVSPFVDLTGLGSLQAPLLSSLARGVRVRLFAHDAVNIATQTSKALEELRREAERVRGNFRVYSAEAGTGRDRLLNPFLHAKIVVCDHPLCQQ